MPISQFDMMVQERGGSLRRQRREVGPAPSPVRWTVSLLLLGFLLLPGSLLFMLSIPSWVSAIEPPVWTSDFRAIFYDIEYLNEETAVVVGGYGRILVSHPKFKNLWRTRDSGTDEVLTCLSFVDEQNGWAAGHGGVIIHTADGGQTWGVQRESAPKNQPLFDIQFLTPKVGYACGAYDSFLKTTDGGGTWTLIAPGDDLIYNSLAFIDEETGYLAGEFGTVLKTADGGESWEKLDLGGFGGTLFGITLVSPQRILVYGIQGNTFLSDDGGRHWVDVSAEGPGKSLFRGAVHGDMVVLVGSTGNIVVSRDGGKTFAKRAQKGFSTYAGIVPHPLGGFVCVGERGTIERLQVAGEEQKKDVP